METSPIDIGHINDKVLIFAGACKILKTPAKIKDLPQKVVEYTPQPSGAVKYIPQHFENIAGVLGKNPQLLQYSLTSPS